MFLLECLIDFFLLAFKKWIDFLSKFFLFQRFISSSITLPSYSLRALEGVDDIRAIITTKFFVFITESEVLSNSEEHRHKELL